MFICFVLENLSLDLILSSLSILMTGKVLCHRYLVGGGYLVGRHCVSGTPGESDITCLELRSLRDCSLRYLLEDFSPSYFHFACRVCYV